MTKYVELHKDDGSRILFKADAIREVSDHERDPTTASSTGWR